MQDNADTGLIARTQLGDTEAFRLLVDNYKDSVYRHCFAVVRDEAVAEDMAQETFITAFYKSNNYNPQYRLATWLFTIATNNCLNYIKKNRRLVRASEVLLDKQATSLPSPQVVAERHELAELVMRLRPNYRAVISLYYWQGLDYAETAAALDVPINTVRVWLKRAKAELRKELS